MKAKLTMAFLSAALLSGGAIAQQANEAPGLLERGLARIEKAVMRLEAKLAGRKSEGHMDGCHEMMEGGMMGGGKMGGGMMGGGARGGPNEQWRDPPAR